MKVILVPTPRHVEDADVFLSVRLARKTTGEITWRGTLSLRLSLVFALAARRLPEQAILPVFRTSLLKKQDYTRGSGVGADADCFELPHL